MAQQFTVTCPLGAESLLALELRRIGIQRTKTSKGSVLVTGGHREAYSACLWSRVASRVLWQLKRFEALTAEELYDGLFAIPWHEHIPNTGTLWVDFSGRSRFIRNEQFGAQKSKDAIVDQIRKATGERPDIQKYSPDIRVHIRLHHGLVVAQIDLSGSPLHLRTPNKKINDAPLKENLAASLLIAADWPRKARQGASFADPMCGSGTIILEAAGMAANRAPGLERQYWGFSNWMKHNEQAWSQLVEKAKEDEKPQSDVLFASDLDPHSVEAARHNAQQMGFDKIQFTQRDVLEFKRPKGDSGVLITNPPYGTRLGLIEELIPMYENLGHMFKGELDNWDAYVFCPANQLSKSIGLKSKSRLPLMNGALDCRLLHFPIQGRKE